MLIERAVSDLALLVRVRGALGRGLTFLTGETGAGKSLLIDALLLVLGGRADAGLLRAGAATARVEALFERLPEPLIAVRELSATGRSVARLDDETVTAARLATAIAPLVEIHGQHEQQRLLSAAYQLDLLDAYGGLGADRDSVAATVGAWRENQARLRELSLDPAELQRRLELARALARNPETILLDEPAAGLSAPEQAYLAERLRVFKTRGLAMVIVDHNLGFLLGLADRVACLDQGRLVAIGTPDQVRNDPAVIAAYIGHAPQPAPASEAVARAHREPSR